MLKRATRSESLANLTRVAPPRAAHRRPRGALRERRPFDGGGPRRTHAGAVRGAPRAHAIPDCRRRGADARPRPVRRRALRDARDLLRPRDHSETARSCQLGRADALRLSPRQGRAAAVARRRHLGCELPGVRDGFAFEPSGTLDASSRRFRFRPQTSQGSVPSAGQDVTLPANSKVVIVRSVIGRLGVITVPLTSELIFGEHEAAPITLDVSGMEVRGALRAGSETCRYATELVITLHGARPADLSVQGTSATATPAYKGIAVNGGVISLHGDWGRPTWSRLAASVPAGQSHLLLQEPVVGWRPGMEVVLVTTAVHDSRAWHRNEVLSIDRVVDRPVPGVGAAVHLRGVAQHAHVARRGYQAEVGLLSRNIKVRGDDGSEPTDPDPGSCTGTYHHGANFAPCPYTDTTGFGGHIVVHSGGKGYLEGVELYRMGQTNVLGRQVTLYLLLTARGQRP